MNSDLKSAIENMHVCKAIWVESVSVKEVFQSEIVWEGIVEVFDLIDHPTAKRCYAWSHSIDDSKKRKYFAVLHQGPVDAPEKAVRAAVINDYKKGQL